MTGGRAAAVWLMVVAWVLVACGSNGGGGASAASSPTAGPLPSPMPAPSFSLVDQFGHSARLSNFRGDVILLSFVDSRCTTICPLTAALMTEAKQALGPEVPVQLLAINANPEFTSVSDVRRWSIRHRMLKKWLFLTGPVDTLRAIWSTYGIESDVVHGDVAHTAVIFLIDEEGRIRGTIPIAERSGIAAEAQSVAQAVRAMIQSGR